MKYAIIWCLLICTLVFTGKPAAAQQFWSAQAKRGLAKPVNINQGKTSVGQLLLALAKQTGLHMQMTPWLRGHRLLCKLNGVTAQQALNALAAMNHWRWYESTKPAYIVLLGRKSMLPASVAQLPAALKQDMPVEFLHIIYTHNHTDNPFFEKMQKNMNLAKHAGNLPLYTILSGFLSMQTQQDRSTLSICLQRSDAILHNHPNGLLEKYPASLQHKLLERLLSTGFDALDTGLFDAVPPPLQFLPQTDIQVSSSANGSFVSWQLTLGKPMANHFTWGGNLLFLNP